MKRAGVCRFLWIILAALVMVPGLSGKTLAWAPATHAHIEKQLYKARGQVTQDILNNRIYGATALDIFNFSFTAPFPACAAYFHKPEEQNFWQVWDKADMQRAFAYGFVSHNNSWGMDATAHLSALTGGRGQGYVIAKAEVLAGLLKETEEYKALIYLLGGPLPDNVVQDVCHYIIEYGVDLLVRQQDPGIGLDLYQAAAGRDPAVPNLLIAAYAEEPEFKALIGPLDAATFLTGAELGFRQAMMSYGLALASPAAQDNVAAFLTDFGLQYLGSLGFPDYLLDILRPYIGQVVARGLTLTMTEVCAADWSRELKAAKGWVNGRLSSHGVAW